MAQNRRISDLYRCFAWSVPLNAVMLANASQKVRFLPYDTVLSLKERVVRLIVASGQDHLLTNGQPLHVRHNVNQLVPVVSRAVGSASEDTTPVSGTP